MSKRDKGKGIQGAEDYQLQISTQNQFSPLPNFPPLSYKNAITSPSTQHTQDNCYVTRHTEHLFLTTHKTTPSADLLKRMIQKSFGTNHFATDDSGKTRQFYELILVDTHSIDITHTHNIMHPRFILYSKCIIQNVITFSQWKNSFEECKFSIPYEPFDL